jgi:hypothetical protein
MSLIQSAINQIGREIGRDIYRNRGGITNKKSYSKFSDPNESILAEISDFKLAAYDKVSVRQLANLIEATEKINPNSFSWEEPFIELDSKIDFAKEHLDKEFLNTLEDLDKKNSINHQTFKLEHKKFVINQIKIYEELTSEFDKKNGLVAFFLSLFGLGRLYFEFNIGVLLWHLIITNASLYCACYFGYSLITGPKIWSSITAGRAIIGGIIYLVIILVVLSKFNKFKKIHIINKNYLQKLIEYKAALK